MNKKVLVVCLLIVFVVGFFGSFFTGGEVDKWYIENKPNYTPPNWVFGPVWIIIYFLIGLSLYFAWVNSKKDEKKIVGIVFGVNLVLNGMWSYLFFGLQNALWAFIDIILIWFSIIVMIYTVWKIDRKSAWLLVPYLLWVSFAGVLNWGFL
jgi:translocator protein